MLTPGRAVSSLACGCALWLVPGCAAEVSVSLLGGSTQTAMPDEPTPTSSQPSVEPTVTQSSQPDASDVPAPSQSSVSDASVDDTTPSATSSQGTGASSNADAGSEDASAHPQRDAGPEAGTDAAEPTTAVLLHHYDFVGTGTEVLDRVGGAHGVALAGAVLDGEGGITLDGVDDYVDLPNGLISGLDAVTFVLWLEWHGGGCWQRVFDFGNTPEGEDVATQAETSLFLTPASCPESHVGPVDEFVLSAMFHVRGSAYTLQHTEGLPTNTLTQLALSASPDSGLTLYLDGQLVQETPAPLQVSEIEDVNNWLGRSQWGQDGFLAARLLDVRLYDGALRPEEVAALYAATQPNP